MKALDIQEGGTHYKGLKIQPIEYIHANGLDFFQGNMLKYLTRHKSKNGAEDLRKVIHYAQLAIELQYGESEAKAEPQPAPSNDGWIEWKGGDCPVPVGALVDVKHKDGDRYFNQQAGRVYAEDWEHSGCFADIIAYRLSHQASKS